MKANYLSAAGQLQNFEMGCYGIGISRIVAAAIEQNHDQRGIIFPESMAPFQLAIIPIGMHKSDQVSREAEKLYKLFLSNHIEVLLDDRNERPGIMFADTELIGIPHRIVISDRGLLQANVEYKGRADQDAQTVSLHEIVSFMLKKLCTN